MVRFVLAEDDQSDLLELQGLDDQTRRAAKPRLFVEPAFDPALNLVGGDGRVRDSPEAHDLRIVEPAKEVRRVRPLDRAKVDELAADHPPPVTREATVNAPDQ